MFVVSEPLGWESFVTKQRVTSTVPVIGVDLPSPVPRGAVWLWSTLGSQPAALTLVREGGGPLRA